MDFQSFMYRLNVNFLYVMLFKFLCGIYAGSNSGSLHVN